MRHLEDTTFKFINLLKESMELPKIGEKSEIEENGQVITIEVTCCARFGFAGIHIDFKSKTHEYHYHSTRRMLAMTKEPLVDKTRIITRVISGKIVAKYDCYGDVKDVLFKPDKDKSGKYINIYNVSYKDSDDKTVTEKLTDNKQISELNKFRFVVETRED